MTQEHLEIQKWIYSEIPLTKAIFEIYKLQTRDLTSSDQLLFFKKVINEIARGHITLTISEISQIKTFNLENFQEFNEPKSLDYTLDLIIHTLEFVSINGKFPEDVKEVFNLVKNIADFICNYLQNNIDYLTKINLLFDDCIGRTAIVKKSTNDYYIKLRGSNYKVYDMYQGYSIKNQDKSGNGTLVQHFQKGIYAKGIVCLLEVIERKPNKDSDDYKKYGKNIEFNEQKFPFDWKKDANNFLIVPDKLPVKSCEGRKSEKPCELSSNNFWWCYGRKCLKANQNDHGISEWKNYTLRDFLKILGLSYNDAGYYIFVSEINRLNRLLERIKCNECSKILRPSKQSNFGFYRVSNFHCKNDACQSKDKEVYLTHCLNSKCTNVIDDRVAKRCPNGFIICDKCGSCCSNEQFSRRIESLKANGQTLSQKLTSMLSEQKGHWEKAECYCYKCQNEMIAKGGTFSCKSCSISYDRNEVYIKFFKGYKNIMLQKAQLKNSP